MEIIVKKEENVLILSLEGNLLGENDGQPILDIVNDSIKKGVSNFIFEVEKLKYLNSTGLSILISTLTKARKNEGELCLVNIQEQLGSLLKITKLDSVFPFCTSLEDAVLKFKTYNKK